jgi:molybdate transport system substrate-binding protein
MSSLNILSGGAAQGLVGSLAPAFKAKTGLDIAGEFGAVGAMADKLRGGTPADIVILTAALVAKLAEEKLIVAASIADVGRVETALAVRAGDPQVAVKDTADLRVAFLASDAIFVPDTKASTAGNHVAKILDQLGIADDVAPQLRIFPNGATAMRELAATQAQRPIGCTQATEIIGTRGVTLSGPLPPGCELATMYTAGVTTEAAHPTQARNLIDLLIGVGRHEQRKRAGFISGENRGASPHR